MKALSQKRFLSLYLAVLMLLGVINIPAIAVQNLPETGIILFENFEGYAADEPIGTISKGTGLWTRALAYAGDLGGNKFWSVNHSPYDDYTDNLAFSLSAAGYAQNEIRTGTLLFEYDVYFPDCGELTSGKKTGHYITNYAANWSDATPNNNRAYLAYSEYAGDTAKLIFPTVSVGYSGTGNTNVSTEISFDTWHRVSHLLNYTAGTVDHYVDGRYIGSFAGGADRMADFYAFSETYIYHNGANLTDGSPNVYLDNILLERLSGQETIDISVKKVGESAIDLALSRAADLSALSASDFLLKKFGGEGLGAPISVKIDGANIRLTYGESFSAGSYELYLNRDLTALVNPASKIPAGKKIDFVVNLGEVRTELLNLDFEAVTFPTATTPDASFAEVAQSYMPGETAQNPSVYGSTSAWKFRDVTDESAFLKSIKHKNSTMLHIDHNAAMTLAEGALDIHFPMSRPVSAGKVEISFDVLKNGASTQFLAFGLREKDITGDVKFDPMTSWSGSTLFGGYTAWSGHRLSVVTNNSGTPNQIPDGYANNSNSSNKPNSGTWTYLSNAVLITDNYVNSAVLTDNVVHSWKFIIDLDKKSYEVYLDGTLKKTMPYIPGGTTGSYDAFTVNLMQGSNTASIPAETKRNVLIDNIKVTAVEPKLTATALTFRKYDGSEFGHSSILSAGTKQAVISFSKEISTQSLSSITVTDAKNTAYQVTKEGNNAVITFENCLAPETAYTIAIGANVADLSGNTLGQPTSFSFTSDAGEKIIQAPVLISKGSSLTVASNIRLGQTLTASAKVINTTAERQGAYLLVASYKNGMLAGVQKKAVTASDCFDSSVSFDFVADAAFVGANEIKLFLLSSPQDVQPLTAPAILSGDAAAYISLNSADPVGYLMDAGMRSGVAPTVTTVGGRTGWSLDPSLLNASYLCVNIDNGYLYHTDYEDTVQVTIDYYDDSCSGFTLMYTDHSGKLRGEYVQMQQTSSWQTAVLTLYDAAVNNGEQLYGDDFRIITNDSELATDEQVFMGTADYAVVIGGVTVRRLSGASPYDITVETGKLGNIFYENEALDFTVHMTDASSTGGYENGNLTYNIYDYNGVIVADGEVAFAAEMANITLPELPFGVYTMTLTVDENDVYQTKTVDFSRSPKAKAVNKQFGTCLHVGSWEVYSDAEVTGLLDLVKNAGYGVVRPGAFGWAEIEPNGDGNYVMPAQTLLAHKYASDIGLEVQMIMDQQNPHYAEYDHPEYIYWLTKPENRAAYANYCAYVVGALKDYVDYFSVCGEFNLHGPGGWHPFDAYWSNHNAENYIHYYNIVKDSYAAIMAANPDAYMVNGIVGRYEPEWIQECFDLGIMDYSDAFAIDIYDFPARPEYDETLETPIREFYEQVKTENPQKGAWITENGWPTQQRGFVGRKKTNMTTEEKQARYYARAMAMYSDKSRIDKFIFYSFINNNTGYFWQEYNFGVIYAHDYRTPYAAKPAYISGAAFNSIVGDATFYGDQNTADGGYYDYKFVNADGEEIMMLWCEEGNAEKNYTYTSDKPFLEIYDMYGNQKTVANSGSYTVTMGPAPIYVKGVH